MQSSLTLIASVFNFLLLSPQLVLLKVPLLLRKLLLHNQATDSELVTPPTQPPYLNYYAHDHLFNRLDLPIYLAQKDPH
jgi:hypothetical protein